MASQKFSGKKQRNIVRRRLRLTRLGRQGGDKQAFSIGDEMARHQAGRGWGSLDQLEAELAALDVPPGGGQ